MIKNIKKVSKFMTSDGTLHDSQNEAYNHELMLTIGTKIKAIYHPNFAANRADSLLVGILSDPKPIRDALTYYIKCQRKTTEKANG